MAVDLNSLKSIRKFAKEFLETKLPINVLMCNAGIMLVPQGKTDDGFESHIGVNHIGHQALVTLLLDRIKQSQPARVIITAAMSYVCSDIHWDDINWEKNTYKKWVAYSQSKTANIMFANYLNALFKKEGVKAVANSLHPGIFSSNLGRHAKREDFKEIKETLPGPQPRHKSIPQGAATQVMLAVHPDYETVGGQYFSDCQPEPLKKTYVTDLENCAKLFSVTEKLIASKQ